LHEAEFRIKAPAAILDGILARPMGRGAGSWPLLQQANKPLYQILGEMLVLFRPRLNSREDVSFVANSETHMSTLLMQEG